MSPRRCLPSWLGRQLHANNDEDLAGAGLAVALPVHLARVLPGGLARVLPGGPERALPWRTNFPGKDLAGGLVGFFGVDSCYPHFILSILCIHKDQHTTTEVPPEPCPTHLSGVGGLEGGSLRLVWASCPGKGLAGAAEAAPERVLAGETCYAYLIFVALVLVVALLSLWSRLLSGFPFLPCLCMPMAGCSDYPCTSKGVKRRAPTFVHR